MNALAPTLLAPPAPASALRQALLTDRDRTLTRLYQTTFPMVRRHVLRHGGDAADAKDVFHDALVIFYEKMAAGTLELTAAPSTYLTAIGRNLWLRELARRQRPVTDPGAEASQQPDEPEPPAAELSVLAYVERLGEKCRDILVSFYYFQVPLERIAAVHQYASVRSATVQKFKCLERLRKAVRAVLGPDQNPVA